jgi:hypothetical protein
MTKINFKLLAKFFFFLSFCASFSLAAELEKSTTDNIDPSRFSSVAVIQGLNKTTAKTSIIEIKVGEKITFGSLKIIAHKCWQAPLDQKPDSKMLIEVLETKNEDKTVKEERIFYGWMFASTPSISGLEHPIYDLTAIACKNK